MGTRFNADEVFEMALQIERNGAAFYRRAAEIVTDRKSRDLLLALARKEDEHEATFVAMRAKLSGPETEPPVYDPEGEAALYLQALANREVFDVGTDPATSLTGRETLQEILCAAIGREKDSIVFYTGLKELVPERLGQGRMDAIIKEEMSHIRILSQEMARAKG
ncbi:MAG: rubrerythrin [Chloroflexota bacterium]|nr:MAG: rubrerythrin [Chloroflexota bacterium]